MIENSYGQTQQESGNTTFFIFVQTQIRNSDNQLIAYLEADKKIIILDPRLLNNFLDLRTPISTLTREGQQFEIIKIDLQNQITESNTISKTALATVADGRQIIMAYSDHDGYPIVFGDTVTSSWVIIRPAR
ncbi:MAG: hypothetical protein ACRD92_04815 [Nitrosopumilaceae archaeon]